MNTTPRVSITDFLLARIAEDEATARAFTGGYTEPGVYMIGDDLGAGHLAIDPARFLRECRAKRRIIASHQSAVEPGDYPLVMRLLAAIYDDHPDYDPAWSLS